MKKNKSNFAFLILFAFGSIIKANDRIEKLILRIDIDKMRMLFDSDILLRAEDKDRYINLCKTNVQKIKLDIKKNELHKQDFKKIACGLIGLYAFRKSLTWVKFFKVQNDSAVDLHKNNTRYNELDIDTDEETEYKIEITAVFKYLTYASSSLLLYFSLKQIHDGLTKKFRKLQYNKAITILAMLERMAVRKDLDRRKSNDIKVL